MNVVALTIEHLEAYLVHAAAHSAESGRDGDEYFGPYGHDVPYDVDLMRERTRERWTKSLDDPGWRRVWGVFDGERITGTGEVTGRELAAERHRVQLGMGVLRGSRHRGIGRAIIGAIIAWCRGQPSIAWLDLGIIGDNEPARNLYRAMGFEELCVVRDRWRMDGRGFDDTSMTLRV